MLIVGIGLRLCARRISRPLWQNGSWSQPGIALNPAFQPIGESCSLGSVIPRFLEITKMSFFKTLYPLIADNAYVAVTLSVQPDGLLAVTVTPSGAKAGTGGIKVPLGLSGTPEELDAEFASLVGAYAASRKTLNEQLATAQAEMQAAAKKATPAKLAKAAAPATPTPVSVDDLEPEDESDDDEKDEGCTPQPIQKSEPKSGELDLASLL